MALNHTDAELTLPALREEFDRLREWLEHFAEAAEMPLLDIQKILIAADEIFTNIAMYAYSQPGGTVTVQVQLADTGALQVHFFDRGIPFDPLAHQKPDTSTPLAQRALGGLGIAVVKKMVDAVHYEHVDGRNHLVLTKHFEPAKERQP